MLENINQCYLRWGTVACYTPVIGYNERTQKEFWRQELQHSENDPEEKNDTSG